ncbi:MAG TPA: carboxymuconolactone decarboxylase family protein [Pseudonocardiaceae bacterium]|jgi:AhpD family alkylhydroperoxidase|nr:carboxymuconolactone decarboxylase family protein [Pseudonocardiaceae bacterium]
MPRIPEVPADQAGWVTKLVYRFSRRRFGAVMQPVSVMAQHSRLLVGYVIGETAALRTATVLPASVRELAVYRAATRVGCSWCVDFGTMLMHRQGLDIDRLLHIDEYATSPHFTDLDRLVIAYADAMSDQPMHVTDEQVAELDRRLGHRGLVELTFVIAQENQRSRFNKALGLTDQGFTSGDACRVPMPGQRVQSEASE